MKQLRVLLDTNIFEEFLLEQNQAMLTELSKRERFIVYGCKIIRDELRQIPKNLHRGRKKLRIALLNIYDVLVKEHSLKETDLANFLALQYAKEFTGAISTPKIWSDFLIVAIASVHQLDIVCSNDEKTMTSKQAIKAYLKVNSANNLRTPAFYTFIKLKKRLEK